MAPQSPVGLEQAIADAWAALIEAACHLGHRTPLHLFDRLRVEDLLPPGREVHSHHRQAAVPTSME
ncbi:MAG TPA: hypothetical protein VJK02_23270 [Anaerolineales bacterium]|nr:hypothetical protein [Anaerolineales bacterium]